MSNNKGFTLVELLVAVSILAILTVLAIPTLRAFQQKNQTTQYANYKESLQTSGKLYNDSYSDDIFGEAPFGCEKVQLTELMNKNVAKDISLKDVSCNISYNNSFVVLRKFGSEYSYKAYLYCEDNEHSVRYSDMDEEFGLCANANKPPRVDVTYKEAQSNKTKDKSVVVTLIDEYGFTANQSFEYGWTKKTTISSLTDADFKKVYNYNNEVKKSTGKEVTLKSKGIVPDVELNEDWRLAIRPKKVQNIVGLSNTEVQLTGPFRFDHTAPACPEVTVVDQNGNPVASGHSAKEITFKINFKNKETDFKSFDVEQSFNGGAFKSIGTNQVADTYEPNAEGSYKLKIKPRDYAGNVNNNCVTGTYSEDRTPPKCPTITAKAGSKAFKINNWTSADTVDFTFTFSKDTTKWDWYTDSSSGTMTVDSINFKLWNSKLSTSTKTRSISGEGERKILPAVYDEAGNVNNKCVSKFWGIDRCGKVTYKNGTTCSAACGNGTYNRLAYSVYSGKRCPDKDQSSGGTACKLKDCTIKPKTPTITNSHNNTWTNKKYTFSMKTSTAASNIGGWYWKWDGGSWSKYANSAGTNTFTSQKMDKEKDKKLYIKVCSIHATSVSDSANCSDAVYTTIKTDFTAPVMYTTNNGSFAYKPTRRKPYSKGVKIVNVTCHAKASNNADYKNEICKHWSWDYTKVPPSGGEFWWGWDNISCKDAGGSGCKKEYWAWHHDSKKSAKWCKWNKKISKSKKVSTANCNKGTTAAYDKNFFAGTDRPSYKHGWAYATDNAGNTSDEFEYYMTATYNG